MELNYEEGRLNCRKQMEKKGQGRRIPETQGKEAKDNFSKHVRLCPFQSSFFSCLPSTCNVSETLLM